MKQYLEEEAEIRRYLLDELTTEERVSVEARLFLDDEYLSQLKAVEDELVDDYAYDELDESEREKVRARLLSEPGRREDLRIARAFKRYLSQHEREPVTPPVAPASDNRPASDEKSPGPLKNGNTSFLASLFRHRPVVGYALAAAALVILSAFIWFSLKSSRRQDQSPQMQAQEPTPQQSKPVEHEQPGGDLQANQSPSIRGEDIAQHEGGTRQGAGGEEKKAHAGRRDEHPQEAPTQARQTQAQVATFLVLPGGGVRGPGGSEKITLSTDVGTVVLRLPLITTGDYQHYRATLQEGDRAVYSRAGLKPEVDAEVGRVVAVKLPANLLHTRRYKMKLEGVTAAGQSLNLSSYTFEVSRP